MTFNLKKDRKKKISTGNKSLEHIHENKIKYFKSLQESLPQKKKEYLKTKDELLKKSILDIENKVEENAYFLDTCDIIHSYMTAEEPESRYFLTRDYYRCCGIPFIEDLKFEKTLQNCSDCDLELFLTDEKFYTCRECGKIYDRVCDGVSFSDIETSNPVYPFSYKRINYFTEWIMKIQAIENVDIEESLLDEIKLELKKRNINNSSKLSKSKLKTILKEINRTNYYEHIPLLISKLFGIKPLRISSKDTENLKEMFLKIQEPYEELKGDRKNFFSYPYILYKFCELLDMPEYLSHFQLLKNREKLMKQDVLWKKIIFKLVQEGENRDFWRFIPTC